MSHFWGAYLRIKVRPKVREYQVRACVNAHEGVGKYCSECGEPIEIQTRVEHEFPVKFDDLLEGSWWVDEMAIITPPSLFRSGVIIAKDNRVGSESTWICLPPVGAIIQEWAFPTPDEIGHMKLCLAKRHARIIEALRASPLVKSADVLAGYVLEVEY